MKLLEHTIKIVERITERRVRELVNIDSMQFGFLLGRGTTDALFIVRRCRRNIGIKRKSCSLVLVILRRHLIEFQ